METDTLTSQLNQTTQDFNLTFGSLSVEQINWKPDANTWSIAQNIDHLVVINESYYPILDAVRDGTYKLPFVGQFNIITHFLGKLVLKSVQPDRKKKIKTFKIWEPTQESMITGILEKFEKHQEELKSKIESSKDLLVQDTVISSPANKNIVYKLSFAFDIIIAHERRHFEQAKEVLKSLPKT